MSSPSVLSARASIIDHQEILVAEFQYIAQTAFQANEDRARVSQFYFIYFGAFLAALFSSQLADLDSHQVYIGFVLVFLLITTFGGLTLLQLARLRQAWIESL